MPLPALALIARTEAARHWRSLVVLALLVGVTGGLVVGGASLVRRTTTVPERLREAVAPGDVHLDLLGADISDEVVALPQVEAWTSSGLLIGRLDGPAVVYLGISAVEQADPEVLRPVVVEGRAADPADPTEVVVLEDLTAQAGVGPGDTLALDLLSPEEVRQFDVGFGDPDGPRVELRVTGVVRVPPGVYGSSPVLATPALAEELPGSVAATSVAVRLRDEADLGAFRAAVDDVADEVGVDVGAEEFPPVAYTDPDQACRGPRPGVAGGGRAGHRRRGGHRDVRCQPRPPGLHPRAVRLGGRRRGGRCHRRHRRGPRRRRADRRGRRRGQRAGARRGRGGGSPGADARDRRRGLGAARGAGAAGR